jgi:hypothetical protein
VLKRFGYYSTESNAAAADKDKMTKIGACFNYTQRTYHGNFQRAGFY